MRIQIDELEVSARDVVVRFWKENKYDNNLYDVLESFRSEIEQLREEINKLKSTTPQE